MSEPLCPQCGQRRPNGWTEAVRKRKSANIKAALAIADRVGRYRETDYAKIYQLRDGGMSLQKIADTLRISRGSVQHALRVRP